MTTAAAFDNPAWLKLDLYCKGLRLYDSFPMQTLKQKLLGAAVRRMMSRRMAAAS